MTNFTLGRIGLDADINDVSQWDASDETVTVSFSTPMVAEGGSLARSNAYRQMLLGYVETQDQRFVAVTWEDDVTANGYYRVRSASVTPDPDLALDGLYYFTAELERVLGYGTPGIQTTYLFRERVNVHDVSAAAYLGQPSGTYTTWGYAYEPEDGTYGGASSTHVYSTEDGSCGAVLGSITGGSGPSAGELALWIRNIDPAGYYVGSARFEVNGYPVEGRQVPRNWKDNWRITNGGVELKMDAAGISGGDAIFQMRAWGGASWVDPIPITLHGDDTAVSPRDPFKSPSSVTILKNTTEEVIVRFGLKVGGRSWPVFLDITCRRGSRYFACRLRRASGTGSAYPAISAPDHLTAYGWRREGAWVSAGPIVEKNYIWNCRALLTGTYWDRYQSNGTASRLTGLTEFGSTGITTGFRVTATGAHGTNLFGVQHGLSGTTTPNGGLLAATVYSIGAWVRCSISRTLTFTMQWRNGSGALISSVTQDIAVTANTWAQVKIQNSTSPANTARISCHITGNSGGAAWTTGDTLDMSGLQLEAGATLTTDFWDGDHGMSDDYNCMYEWEAGPDCGSLKMYRLVDPTYWFVSPIATVQDSDAWEPDPAVDDDPVSWDFGFGMLQTGASGDAGRYLREVQGYYMSITQSDDVVAL